MSIPKEFPHRIIPGNKLNFRPGIPRNSLNSGISGIPENYLTHNTNMVFFQFRFLCTRLKKKINFHVLYCND